MELLSAFHEVEHTGELEEITDSEKRTVYLGIDPSADYKSNIAAVHHAQRRDVARWIRAGKAAGTFPVPITLVPGHLNDETIAAIA